MTLRPNDIPEPLITGSLPYRGSIIRAELLEGGFVRLWEFGKTRYGDIGQRHVHPDYGYYLGSAVIEGKHLTRCTASLPFDLIEKLGPICRELVVRVERRLSR